MDDPPASACQELGLSHDVQCDLFLQLNLFHLDYIDEDYYSVAPGINFRHYKVYYNLAFQLSIYIWRKKIREVLVCGFFFETKKYEDPDYLEIFKLKKIED